MTRDVRQVTRIPATWRRGNSFRHNNFAERITPGAPAGITYKWRTLSARGAPLNRFIQAVPAHGHTGVYLTVSSAATAIFLKLFRPGPLPAPDDRDVKPFRRRRRQRRRRQRGRWLARNCDTEQLLSFMGKSLKYRTTSPECSPPCVSTLLRLEVRDL